MSKKIPSSARLMYITYHENILYSGILRSQVQKMLEGLPSQERVEQVILLCFINPYHFWRDRGKWRELRSELSLRGVRLIKRPMFFTSRWPWWSMLCGLLLAVPLLILEIWRNSINILHSRSYAAGLIAQSARELTGVAHIFDPRGPFPVEMTTNQTWKSDGHTHRFWLKVESWLIRRSSAVVAVTPGYRDLFRKMGAYKAVFIPNRGDVAFFAEKSTGVNLDDPPTIAFCGGMESAWYHPRRIGQIFLAVKSVRPDCKLYLISHVAREQVQSTFRNLGIADSEWFIKGAAPQDVPEQLARCAMGLILGFRAEGGWPVKFAEYLACGLPLLVEKKIGEQITQPVEKWKLGVVVDEDDADTFLRIEEALKNRAAYSRRCREYALKRLDIARTSRQTARLYRQALGIAVMQNAECRMQSEAIVLSSVGEKLTCRAR